MSNPEERVLDGTRLRIEGAGPPLVLIHGVGLDLEMWDAQALALAPHFRVVRYDLLGHGGSHDPPGARSVGDFVAQLRGLLDGLALERVALAGFSLGALIGRAFALTHPERLDKLALLYGVYGRTAAQDAAVQARIAQAERDGTGSLIESALGRWFTPDFLAGDPPLVAKIRARLEANDPQAFLKAYRIFGRADAEMAAFPGQVTCPCLVATGEADVGSTPEMARRLARDIPDARLKIFAGHRHMGLVEDPAVANRALLAFLLEEPDAA